MIRLVAIGELAEGNVPIRNPSPPIFEICEGFELIVDYKADEMVNGVFTLTCKFKIVILTSRVFSSDQLSNLVIKIFIVVFDRRSTVRV